MDGRPPEASRDRAILIVRVATAGGVASAVGLTWLFATLAETYFSGRPPAAQLPPNVPVAAAPVQKAPPVIQTVVHHPGYAPAAGGTAPRPPAQGPAAAPAPPPAPVCHSTPSKPC
ncbi:MAG TPA: hypothetical protein VGG90_03790 [Candidatus Dormibacteraeota bacterium]|jgi:hypothetical protein